MRTKTKISHRGHIDRIRVQNQNLGNQPQIKTDVCSS